MEKKQSLLVLFVLIIIASMIPIFPVKAQMCQQVVDMVFVVDTSGSMGDEWTTLCSVIGNVVSDISGQGIDLRYDIYYLTQPYPGGNDTCSTGGTSPACPCNFFADGCAQGLQENWGAGTEVIANNYAWRENSLRIILPISDEGPYCGNPCDGNDTTSWQNAAAAANANQVYVFPIVGTGFGGAPQRPCLSGGLDHMDRLVAATSANDSKFLFTGGAASMSNAIQESVRRAVWDGDDDGWMKRGCPCDPANLPPGIIGCYDCDDLVTQVPPNDPNFPPHDCLYGGIVPCGRLVDDPSTVGLDETATCTLCHLFVLAKRAVDNYIVPLIVFPIAVLMVLIGGVLWLTGAGDPGKISQGKSILRAAVIGIVIVLAAWLIIDLIISFITPAGSPFQSWNTINCPVP